MSVHADVSTKASLCPASLARRIASKARSMTRATSFGARAPGGNGARTLCAACQKASCKVRERPSGFLSPLLDANVNAESRERVLYPVDDAYEVHVDEDVSSAFHGVAIPAHDPDWDQALRQIGVEPAPRRAHAARGGDDDDEDDNAGKKKKKKRRAVNFERMKVTNAHLPELFKAPQVERLDG